MIKVLVFSILLPFTLLGSNQPKKDERAEFHSRLFLKKKFQNFSLILKNSISSEHDGQVSSRTSIGVRKRFFDHFKIGLHYQARSGQRYDNDWQKDPTWSWKESSSRFDSVLIGELKALSHLGTERSVFGLNLEFQRNLSQDQSTIKIGPSYKYFILKSDLTPWWTIFANYYRYFALNFSTQSTYQRWAYAGVLYHPNEHFSYGGSFGRRKVYWAGSEEFRRLTGLNYEIINFRLYFALHVNYAF